MINVLLNLICKYKYQMIEGPHANKCLLPEEEKQALINIPPIGIIIIVIMLFSN